MFDNCVLISNMEPTLDIRPYWSQCKQIKNKKINKLVLFGCVFRFQFLYLFIVVFLVHEYIIEGHLLRFCI